MERIEWLSFRWRLLASVCCFILGAILIGSYFMTAHSAPPPLPSLSATPISRVTASPTPVLPIERSESNAGSLDEPTPGISTPDKSSHARRQSSSSSKTKEVVGIINVNTAPASELQKLPGVGPKRAQDIIAYRQQQGPFKSMADLQKIKGIGTKTAAQLKPHVAF